MDWGRNASWLCDRSPETSLHSRDHDGHQDHDYDDGDDVGDHDDDNLPGYVTAPLRHFFTRVTMMALRTMMATRTMIMMMWR